MFRYLAEPINNLAEPRLKNTGLSSTCENSTVNKISFEKEIKKMLSDLDEQECCI
jgi:hypothetical protein